MKEITARESIMTTNAANTRTAAALFNACENGNLKGRFFSLVRTNAGQLRGRAPNKIRVNDTTVQYVGITGFNYAALCERSRAQLAVLVSDPDFVDSLVTPTVDRNTVLEAIAAVDESLAKSAAGVNESTSADAYEPLVVDGTSIPGSKVYTGTTDAKGNDTSERKSNGRRSTEVGDIVLNVLVVGSKVLEEAEHTHFPNSRPLTVAKKAIRRLLPIGRFRTFPLRASGEGATWRLRIGNEAVLHANENGVNLGDVSLEDLGVC